MTTQEFVSHEAIKYKTVSPLVKQGFSNGLTKGLEIAKEFAEWVSISHVQTEEGLWRKYSNQTGVKIDTSELLTIFLTEKYGNNG